MTKYLTLAAVAATSAFVALAPAAHADQYRSGSGLVQTVGYSSKYVYRKYHKPYYGHYYTPSKPWWSYHHKKRWNRFGWNYGYPKRHWR